MIVGEGDRNLLLPMRWGFPSPWEPSKSLINTRIESAASKPTWREPLRQRRCVIPTTGFYEGRGPKGAKQAHHFHLANPATLLAGIWSRLDVGGEATDCFSIITTDANEVMRPYHHRMPLILDEDAMERWLAPGPPESLERFVAASQALTLLISEPPPPLQRKVKPAPKAKEAPPSGQLGLFQDP